MPARRLPLKAGGYLVALHGQYGLILHDAPRHGPADAAMATVYSSRRKGEIRLPQAELWPVASDELSNVEVIHVVGAYQDFRRAHAAGLEPDVGAGRKPGSADGVRELHERFLAARGLRSMGIRPPEQCLPQRSATCLACATPLTNLREPECNACGWIICPACGCCGCGR